MAIEVGNKLEGKVTGITHFGAFVLLPGGETGLVHISEIADSYVRDINEHLKVNDPVTVKVINLDNNKIGLSIRQAQDRPPVAARPPRRPHGGGGGGMNRQTFEDKMSRFMRDSEDRLQALRRSDSKRGGRGGRRG
ncbi:S1 domain-containing RNA-binding protein [Ferroacidibacillus organovorans]|uniref:RNA-binding protein S1 n=1 Tax=Ferroacidibacillus organovorans TaxID=1765683 RepID=A0A162UQ50_9BACL|nr:S1 domain-containing RNA-binding protein [Ferroacidibacillus organovorans]KYP81947.1 RNA-binding protein S1 [Ferroacidibacillus organovorans]OAG94922.1 RNA-binding protein S1 [Ferroacidibacillus organovorans]OPG14999.1 RNA-binding protein S1 [Ferroacidibacillus organovorans]